MKIQELGALGVAVSGALPTPGDAENGHKPIHVARQGDRLWVSQEVFDRLNSIEWPATRESINAAVGDVGFIELPESQSIWDAFTQRPIELWP